mgnify:FL=1
MKVGDLVRNKGYMNNDLMGTGLVYELDRFAIGVHRYKVYWANAEPGFSKRTWESPKDVEVISESR